MCGIAGIVGNVTKSDINIVQSMNDIQSYRGPDNDKVSFYDGAVVGHRRLSIIDLDNRSSQPMESNDGRYIIVFNGEIYNYKELKVELSPHYNFQTRSDTEVLLAAYSIWGKKCLLKLIGMFAFCIYDIKKEEAFIARDYFGQKPLFFTENDKRLIFASEIKAILKTGMKPNPNYNTWARYLVSASYDDDNSTFFKNIFQLLPGEFATWTMNRGLQKNHYYNLGDEIVKNKVDIEQASQATRTLLIDSVKLHMRSDVPVGLALSGGLDSSTMLACLDFSGELNQKLNCLSFKFEEAFSEQEWIDVAASYHGLISRYEVYKKNDYLNDIKPLTWHLEAPIGGLATCALAKLMSRAGKMGLKVMQDGTGLDEAFGGYRNHHNLFLGEMLQKRNLHVKKYIKEYADFWKVTEKVAEKAAKDALNNKITAIDGTVPVRIDLINNDFKTKYNVEINDYVSTGSNLYDGFIDYLQKRKIPRNTRMKDRVSMAYSIELRLPFLEHNLINYALSLPEQIHYYKGRTKSVIREAMKGLMDENVRIAPKRSIQAPQGEWLRKEPMRSYVIDLINSETFADRNIFNVNKVITAYDEFCEGKYNNSFFVWQWINMEEWFRTFIDNDATKKTFQLKTQQ